MIENIMLEDMSTTNLSIEKIPLEENLIKLTCMECNFATTSKIDMDNHVKDKHS